LLETKNPKSKFVNLFLPRSLVVAIYSMLLKLFCCFRRCTAKTWGFSRGKRLFFEL